MRRRAPALALCLIALPLSTTLAQQQPQPRFEPASRTVPAGDRAEESLRTLRAQAADSATRYAGVARRQRLVQRALYLGGAALVAGSYSQWIGGPTRRGMTAGGATLLGAGLASAAYGLDRRDAADRAATTSARWSEVASGRTP